MKRHARPATGAIIGRRPEQQDAVLAEPVDCDDGEPALLLIVADGMGGHAGGQIASRIAVDTFLGAYRMGTQLPDPERLRAALEIANRAIGVKIGERPELRGMGSTFLAALVFGDRVRWISVGDSLLLAIRDQQSIRLNADHSLAPEIDRAAKEGQISPAQAAADPDRHVLLSALNGGRIDMIDEGQQRLGAGTFLLLATDGLDTLPASRIAEIGSGPQSAERKVAVLLDAVAADMPPDQDNTSLAAVHCGRPLRRNDGHRARRNSLGVLLLTLAFAGGGYALWLLTRPDGAQVTQEERNTVSATPDTDGNARDIQRRGPAIEPPRRATVERRPAPDKARVRQPADRTRRPAGNVPPATNGTAAAPAEAQPPASRRPSPPSAPQPPASSAAPERPPRKAESAAERK